MPTVNIEQAWIDTYEANLRHSLQQRDSKLADKVMFGTVEGAKKRFTYIGTAAMTERLTKNGDTPWGDINFYNRWIGRHIFDFAFLIDKFEDVEKALTDPTSSITQAAMFAARRQKDKVIINAFDAPAWTGENAETKVEFDETNQVIDIQTGSPSGAAANQPLNLAKLRELKARFDEAELPEGDPRYIVASPRQIQALLEDDHLTSADFNTVKALVNGDIATFMGFQFVTHNLLPKPSTNVRNCFAWSKCCMQLGVSVDLEINGPTPLPEKNFAPGGEVTMAMDATRLFDAGVFRVPCKE